MSTLVQSRRQLAERVTGRLENSLNLLTRDRKARRRTIDVMRGLWIEMCIVGVVFAILFVH